MDRKRIRRGFVRGLAMAAAAIVALLLLFVLVVRTTPAGNALVNRALSGVAPVPGSSIAVGNVRGNWVTWLEALDVRLTRGDTVLAAVDTIRVHAHPWSLLRGRLDIGSADVAGLYLLHDLVRPSGDADADPSNWMRALRAPEYHGPAIRVVRVRVRDATYGPPEGPALTNIALDARDLNLSNKPAVTLDRLTMRYVPAAPDSAVTDLWLSGALSPAGLDIDSLRLRGPHSDVSGRVALAFGARDDAGEQSLELHARPLDLSDLEMIPGVPHMEGRVEVDASLRGTSIERLNGTATARMDRADLGALQLGATRVTVAIADSRAEVEARTGYNGMDADIRGWVRVQETVPDYDFRIDITGLPRPAAASSDSARVRLHVAGRGFGPDELRVDGTVTHSTSHVELAGRLSGAGEDRREPEWELEKLAFDRVDVSAWAAGAPATDVSGEISARGRGVGPETLHAKASWRLAASRIGDTRIEWASGSAALDGLHMGTSLRVAMGAGEVVVDTVTVTLDLSKGRAVDGSLVMANSTLGEHVVENGRVDFRVREGKLDLTATLTTDAGTAGVKATLTSTPSGRELVVDDGRFGNVNAGAWSSGLPVTQLSGSFSARITMGEGIPPSGSAALHIDPSRVATREMPGGDIAATVEGGRLRADGAIDVGGERVTIDADARLDDGAPRGWARGVVPFSLLAALAGRDSLDSDGEINVMARFVRADSKMDDVRVNIGGAGRFGSCAVDSVLASVRIGNGAAFVDTFRVRSDAADVDAAGRLGPPGATGAAASYLNATVRADNPAALFMLLNTGAAPSAIQRSLLRAEGGTARLTLRGDSLTADVDAKLDDEHQLAFSVIADRDTSAIRLSVTDAHMSAGDAEWRLVHRAGLRLAHDRLDVDSLEFREVRNVDGTKNGNGSKRTTVGRVYVHGTIDRRGQQDFQVTADGVGLDIIAGGLGWDVVEGTLDAGLTLSGSAEAPRATGTIRIAPVVAGTPTGVTVANLQWDGRLAKLRAALTSPQGDSLKVNGRYPLVLSFASGYQKAAVTDANMGLRIEARRFPLETVEALLPPRMGAHVSGWLDADTRFAGQASPSGSGRIAIADGTLDLPKLGVHFEDLQFDGVLDGDRLTLNRVTLKSKDGDLSISGDVRVTSTTRVEQDLTVTARRYTFVDRADLRVVASGEVTLTGSSDAPVVRGALTASGCTYYLAQDILGSTPTEAEITLTPEDRQMLEDAFGYTVRGNRYAARDLFERTDLDVQLTLGRDNWLRKRSSPRLALEITGDVHARKEPGGDFEVTGRVAPLPRRGYIEYIGRTFDFAGGEVLLNGHTDDHTVDARAEYKVRPPRGSDEPEVVVTLSVQGHPDDLSLSLTSEPSMTESEIVSYITTGRSPLRTQTGQDSKGNDALALATDIGLSQVTSGLEEAAQEKIGLDVLQVRYDALLGATLMAGRYVAPRLYIGFQQPLQYRESSSTSTQHPYQTSVELEFELNRWLVVNLQGEVSLLRSYLRARHEY